MQIFGIGILMAVIAYSFTEHDMTHVSAFDPRALVIVLCGSLSAILAGSSRSGLVQTLLCVRELLPFAGTLERGTQKLEDERTRFAALWREGKRAQAVELAEASNAKPIRRMLELVLARSPHQQTETVFLEMRHDELNRWQPATRNWELLAKLGPSFGMMGTIAGMIQLFAHMGNDNLNIGAAMSLALVSTLYGIVLGAGIAGPFGHFLRGLLDRRLGALARCRQSVIELAELPGSSGRG